MVLKTNLVLDFDSTLIKKETLEMLAEEALSRSPQKETIKEKVQEITDLGMKGEIDFSDSLERRLKLFSLNVEDIEKIKQTILKEISVSFQKNKSFFQKNAERIFIVSGGFKRCVLPVAEFFSIPEKNIFANDFIFKSNGEVAGVDKVNFLSQDKGKVKQIENLNFQYPCCVIGDGYTDYEVKKEGLADFFVAYTEHKRRKEVCNEADREAKNFDDVLRALGEFGLVS
jgi:D-3-phosphoglycerate dehydrogenase